MHSILVYSDFYLFEKMENAKAEMDASLKTMTHLIRQFSLYKKKLRLGVQYTWFYAEFKSIETIFLIHPKRFSQKNCDSQY